MVRVANTESYSVFKSTVLRTIALDKKMNNEKRSFSCLFSSANSLFSLNLGKVDRRLLGQIFFNDIIFQ